MRSKSHGFSVVLVLLLLWSGFVHSVHAGSVESGIEPIIIVEEVAEIISEAELISEAVLYDGESLTPSDRIMNKDIMNRFGAGIDESIDPDVDAVKEIYDLDHQDEGLMQLAAELNGVTEETVQDASEVVRNGYVLSESDEAVVADNQITGIMNEDRQKGAAVGFSPSSDPDSAMAYLSAFVLSKVRDGSGDFDETTDYLGNDADESNGVIRTNDDLTYVLSYSTALGDHYLYHTVRGTRLCLEYVLPFSSKEVEFDLEAMSWMKGNGSGGRPVIYETDGQLRLVGYRELPDRLDQYGESYDVPGAGTVNCVVKVKNLPQSTVITPTFYAWIEESGSNESHENVFMDLKADTSACDPSSVVSVGPFLTFTLEKNNSVTPVKHGIDPVSDLIDPVTGEIIHLDGGTRGFYFAVRCGKPNGSIKGVDSVDPSKRIHIEVSVSRGVNTDKDPSIGLYNIRTFSMRTANGMISGALRAEDQTSPYSPGYGTIERAGLNVNNNCISFDVTGLTRYKPGELVTQGAVTFVQKEENAAKNEEKPIYWTALKGEVLKASCLYSYDNTEIDFPVNTEMKIENQMERSGSFDSHLFLTSDRGLAYYLTSGNRATDARIGYGMNFNCYVNTTNTVADEAHLEAARDYFLLWDNRKVELRDGSSSGNRSNLETTAVYRFLTKTDGSYWTGDEEMLSIDFTSVSMYRKLKVWPDYDSAITFLKSCHPDENDVNGYICGTICEAHQITTQEVGGDYSQRIGMKMRVKSDPANIRTAAMFIQAIRCYHQAVTTSYASASGKGSDPSLNQSKVLRNWNLSPMVYEKTSWDENGVLQESSLTTNNSLHKGSTLYIEPYTLKIKEHYSDGSESKTFELSEAERFEIVIEPAFAEGPLTDHASLELHIPFLKNQNQEVITSEVQLYAAIGDEKRLIHDSDRFDLAALIDGAAGSAYVASSEDGYLITIENVSTGYELPKFFLSGIFDKTKININTYVTHTSVITGDGSVETPSSVNGHLASCGMAFTEINGVVLKETVDRAEIMNGEELTYTITFLNCYDDDHPLDLVDVFPVNGDAELSDIMPHGSDPLIISEIESRLAEGAALTYVDGSAAVTTSAGSSIDLDVKEDRLTAAGILKSGESIEITYKMRITGAEDGDVIRNSCFVKDRFGDVYSNRVETKVLPDPELTLQMTLAAGGRGTGIFYMIGGLVFFFAGCLYRRIRKNKE